MSINIPSKYLTKLKKSQELRKDLNLLDYNIEEYKRKNLEIEQTISILQSELNSLTGSNRPSNYLNSPDINMTSGSLQSSDYSRSHSLKKLFTKNFDTEILYESTPELNQKDQNFPLSFHIISLAQRNGKFLDPPLPEILFTFPVDKSLEKSVKVKVIDSSFPDGIMPKGFDSSESIVNQVSEIIYQSHYRDGKSYVNKFIVGGEEIYGCFVLYDDLGTSQNEVQFIVPVCYCLLCIWPCFELHFGVLNRMLDIKRTSRFESSQKFIESEDISTIISEDLITCEEISLLTKYYSSIYQFSVNDLSSIRISLDMVESIDYDFPSDLNNLDELWFCPILFSVLDCRKFCKVFLMILQEKKVVFFSKNLDVLTSSILALNCILYPFEWQYPIIPLLTKSNQDEISNNKSFIIGTNCDVSKHLKNFSFWFVNLDEGKIRYCGKKLEEIRVSIVQTYNLEEKIYMHFRDLLDKICFIPNEAQIYSTKQIVSEIKKFNNWIIHSIQSYCQSKDINSVLIHKEIIKKSNETDKDFFLSVFDTEMFRNYYYPET